MTSSTAIQLAALTERLSNFMDNTEKAINEDRAERLMASAERREILETVNQLKRDMAEVKPVTTFVQSWKARLTGVMLVMGFLGTIVWGGILFWKEQIIAFFHRAFGG